MRSVSVIVATVPKSHINAATDTTAGKTMARPAQKLACHRAKSLGFTRARIGRNARLLKVTDPDPFDGDPGQELSLFKSNRPARRLSVRFSTLFIFRREAC